MATKKQQYAFYEDVLEYILRRGAQNRRIGDLASHYKMETKAGELYITFHEAEASKVFSIFCQFQDVNKAKEILKDSERLNKYSGKWNFHYSDADTALTAFHNEIHPIL